jgi:hypothetical protein
MACITKSRYKNFYSWLGAVAQASKPSYLVGGDEEDQDFRLPWKKVHKTPHLNQWLGVELGAYHPSYMHSINRRIKVQTSLGIK